METKKYDKFNIEKRRAMLLQIAFIITLGLILSIFELNTKKSSGKDLRSNMVLIEMDINDIENRAILKILRPPKPQPDRFETLKVVSDNSKIEKELEFPTSEINENTKIGELQEIMEKQGNEIFTYFETAPEFPNGEKALKQYIAHNTKLIKKEKGIFGKVFVKFTITDKGEIRNVSVVKSINRTLDAHAVGIIANMPCWKPAKIGGREVSTWQILPVVFLPENN